MQSHAGQPGERRARIRQYLMCRPTYYDVNYSINPWMNPELPTSNSRATAQWERLRAVLRELGHSVEVLEPVPGLPDMVFAANGAIVRGDTAMVARFRHPQRTGESAAYLDWFEARGYTEVVQAECVNEGEGDYLQAGERILAGSGFRSDPESHTEVEKLFQLPVVGLTLVNAQFYHLDTALAVLDDDEVMYYPEAFSAESRAVLQELYPDAILATAADAGVFGLNAVSDGRHVVLPQAAADLAARLRERGFEPIGVEMTELLKAGGSAKCCTLELRR
ncbi:arginine deiminase family protein [Kitasatospora sp. NBC_01287]|uniref:dimethylargininase n=1 Tax=Kitasatospora sp. NBC_01287 TaxID=2903573 RepID=UPI00224CE1D9|nr:dimethylargininase [Kitasatospora sp. NBC_01287]MCX4746936.1 arginine deiminase family protein [Kitasatospora sp. NBC_01287]